MCVPPICMASQGVGWRVSRVLSERGVETVADLRRVAPGVLGEWVGANLAASLQRLCRGIDDRQLVFEHDRVQKSIGVEVRVCGVGSSGWERKREWKGEVYVPLLLWSNEGRESALDSWLPSPRSSGRTHLQLEYGGGGVCQHVSRLTLLVRVVVLAGELGRAAVHCGCSGEVHWGPGG